MSQEYSDKSYGTAIILVGLFGILGIHHFYLRNFLHGFFDLGLSVVGFGLIFLSNSGTLALIGVALLVIDAIHSFAVFYLLIVGECHDGDGKLVTYKTQ